MRTTLWNIIAPACLLVFGLTSAEAAYKVAEGGATDGGTLSGRITFDGTPPAPEMLIADEDAEACGGDRPAENLLVSQSGGIGNVVLSIKGIQSGKPWGFSEEFVYDQSQCRFVPHILLIKPQTSGVVKNSDSVGHNFHTISKGIFNTNKISTRSAKGFSIPIRKLMRLRKWQCRETNSDGRAWSGSSVIFIRG